MSPVRWPLRAWRSIIARRIALLAAALRATPLRRWPAKLRTSAERLRAWHGTLGAAPSIAIRVTASALIASAKYHPAFYRGQFELDETGDTFLDMRGWGKGVVWVNGHALGRFWNLGPQQTLYLPAPWLRKGKNEVAIFGLMSPKHRTLRGVRSPVLDELIESAE